MDHPFLRKQVGNEVFVSRVTDHRFKTNRVSVNLIVPLCEDTAGAYAVVPFILRKACRDYPDSIALGRRLAELYGAFLDADVRKLGDVQVLNFSIRTMDNRYALEGEDLLYACCELLCGMILRPLFVDGLFKQADFEVEKQVLIDNIRSKVNDKRSYAVDRCLEEMFAGQPCAVDELGSLKAARSLTNERAVQAYQDMLRFARIEVMFTGVSADEKCETLFAKAFSALRREPSAFSLRGQRKGVQEGDVTERMEVKQAKLVMGFETGGIDSRRSLAALRLMCGLYGGTTFSKLFVNVREKLSLCYYCAARFDRFKGTMLVDSGVEEPNLEKAREEIQAQLDGIKRGDFTDEEMENTVMSLRNSYTSVTDSLSGLESWYLTQALAGDAYSPLEEAAMLSQVTRREVMDAASATGLKMVYTLRSV